MKVSHFNVKIIYVLLGLLISIYLSCQLYCITLYIKQSINRVKLWIIFGLLFIIKVSCSQSTMDVLTETGFKTTGYRTGRQDELESGISYIQFFIIFLFYVIVIFAVISTILL